MTPAVEVFSFHPDKRTPEEVLLIDRYSVRLQFSLRILQLLEVLKERALMIILFVVIESVMSWTK